MSDEDSIDLSLLSSGTESDGYPRNTASQKAARRRQRGGDEDSQDAGMDRSAAARPRAQPGARPAAPVDDADEPSTRRPQLAGASDEASAGIAGDAGTAVDGDPAAGHSGRKRRRKVLTEKKLRRLREQHERKGIVYVSRIPPHMKPAKLKQLLAQYGEVGGGGAQCAVGGNPAPSPGT